MLTKSVFDAYLKEYWTKAAVDANVYENHPLFGMIPKDEGAGGEYVVVPVDLDDGAEGGPTFATAQAIASATSSLKRQFAVTWTEDFQLAQIENKTIRLSRKSPELALESAKRETKRAMRLLSNRIARAIYRSGYGEKGQMNNTGVATGVITLANKADARNFHIGDRLTFSQTLGSALRDAGDYVSVTAINYSAGTVTTDAPIDLATSIAGIATTDFIYGDGMRGAGATPAKLMITGLASWVPTVAPTAGDNFFGVDRSVWVDRLAGLRYSASGPADQVLIDALVEAAQNESYPTHVFICGSKWGELIKALEGRYEQCKESAWEANVGYNGIQIGVGYGANNVKIFPDPNCPEGLAYGLKVDDWNLFSAGPVVQNDLQHVEGVDLAASSGVEYRYVSTLAFGCRTPKHNMVVSFT